MEKLDSKGDEQEDPYKEYNKKIYDYEPTQDELDRFKEMYNFVEWKGKSLR